METGVDRLRAIADEAFRSGPFHTLGDVIDAHRDELPGWENISPRIRDYSLAPQQVFLLPDDYWADLLDAGVDLDTAAKLRELAFECKKDVVAASLDRMEAANHPSFDI